MKKIITALNYPELNKDLQKQKNLKIENKDIIYKEGILEILEIKKEIDIIIINYDLPGKISIENLIQKIKKINSKIELIFILETKDSEKEEILKKNEIKNIYYNDEINTKQLIEIIQEKNQKNKKELEEEIIKLKKIIDENKKQKEKINQKKWKKYLKERIKKKKSYIQKSGTITNSVLIERRKNLDKTILPLQDIRYLKNAKKRILLVDLKLGYEDMHIAFHKTKIYNKIENKNFLIYINKNVKLLTGLSKIIKNNDEKEEKKIISIIEKNAKKYDKIIIEILENNYIQLNQKIMQMVEKNIFILENDFKDIKITKNKLEKYKKINNKNIYLFFYSKEKNKKIDIGILKEIFKKNKIIKKEMLKI